MEQRSQETFGEDRLIQIAMAFNAAWNAGDRDGVLAYFAPTVSFGSSRRHRLLSRNASRGTLRLAAGSIGRSLSHSR